MSDPIQQADELQLPVLILDDGELEDLRYVLEDFGVHFGTRHEDFPRTPLAELPVPTLLLASTPRYAVKTDELLHGSDVATLPMHVVIAEASMSRTASKIVSRVACDLLLRQPVHPTLLQLTVRRAVFRGDERRGGDRVAIGAAVKFKEWLRSYPATLVDLSPGGCKLSSPYSIESGKSLTIIMPKGLTGRRALSLKGRVLAGHDAGFRDLSEHAMSVVFSELNPGDHEVISHIIKTHGVGSTSVKRPERKPKLSPAAQIAPARRLGQDRRKQPRKRFAGNALLKRGSIAVPLIARDLSPTGIRVEQHPDLKLGDKVELILYGKTGAAPIAIQALVKRDDGDDGLTLFFKETNDQMREHLTSLVEALPDSERRGGPPTLITEMIRNP